MRVIICLHAELKKCVQKVGSTLSKYDTIKEVFGIVGDVVKTADFISAGLSNYDVAKFCKEGFIERIKPGFYQFPQNYEIKEETLLSCVDKKMQLGKPCGTRASRGQLVPSRSWLQQKRIRQGGNISIASALTNPFL